MTAIMDLSFPGQRTATATSCIPHDSVYMPGPRAGKSDTVILDSKYPKMTPKFVKQKSHWLHSSIKFANPACSPTCKQNPQPCTCLETQNNLGKLNYKPEWTAILFNHPSIWTANIWWAMTLWCITRHFSGLRLGPDVPLCDSKNI